MRDMKLLVLKASLMLAQRWSRPAGRTLQLGATTIVLVCMDRTDKARILSVTGFVMLFSLL
jgi:hypothetical protein